MQLFASTMISKQLGAIGRPSTPDCAARQRKVAVSRRASSFTGTITLASSGESVAGTDFQSGRRRALGREGLAKGFGAGIRSVGMPQ